MAAGRVVVSGQDAQMLQRLRKALLPSAKKLSGRYPWLEKRPWLLPAAWAARIGTYLKTRGKYGEQSPAASLRIGKERVELLRAYGVIDK